MLLLFVVAAVFIAAVIAVGAVVVAVAVVIVIVVRRNCMASCGRSQDTSFAFEMPWHMSTIVSSPMKRTHDVT